MQRRQFLGITAGTLGGVALSRCGGQGSQPAARGRSRLVSQDGLLTVDLTAVASRVPLAGRHATLLTYNHQVPGPLWEVRAGDTLQVSLTNRLEAPTNLHFHGLHIPPTGQADNALRVIPPGQRQTYQFTLPAQHPGGLFWYHPHHHGTVAEQVFGGLAGGLIVRGAVDDLPEIQAAREAIMILQDFDLDWRGQRRPPASIFRRWGREGTLVTVNGDRPPTLSLPQQGVLRLRLLNAAASRFYRLQLEDHPWHLIGLDGGTLPAPVELDTDLLLAPGERADLLIAGTRPPGQYRLVSLPYDRGIADMLAGMAATDPDLAALARSQQTPTLLAQIAYGDAVPPLPLPTSLLPVAAPSAPVQQRTFVLDHGIDAGQAFLINGRSFDPNRVDTRVQLGTVEDWRIINRAGMDHPFHVHTNAFQVLTQQGQPFPFSAWKDVVNVRAYETVDLRLAFTDFPGKTVYHCHILDHEDQGMMGILEITAENTASPILK